VADFEFDVVVGADGRRNTLEGEKTTKKKDMISIDASRMCCTFKDLTTKSHIKEQAVALCYFPTTQCQNLLPNSLTFFKITVDSN